MKRLKFEILEKLYPILNSTQRYVVLYGSRGGGKSWSTARVLLLRGYLKQLRILCTREIQNTIRDSVHKVLCDQIEKMKLDPFYTIRKDTIIGTNGTEFIFKGLRYNPSEIKSTEGIDVCWVEEAHNVSNESWELLIPTIRKPDSQIFVVFNPNLDDDPTYVKFVKNTPPDMLRIKINYDENYYLPDVLKEEAEYCKKTDYEKWCHIWNGECRRFTEAQVFKNKYIVEYFDTLDDVQFYFGADWGFSTDPTTLIRLFIKDDILYIEDELYKTGITIDKLPDFFSSIQHAKDTIIRADSARPDTIQYMNDHGFPLVVPAEKGKGSVEEGIEYIKSFKKIIIHTRCEHTIEEFKYYSYRTDRVSGRVLPIVVDAHNHMIDAIRYALEDYRKPEPYKPVFLQV